jgi:hypothetical protein
VRTSVWDFSGPAFDTSIYTPWQIFWYVGGFLAWIPCYWIIIKKGFRERFLEIPVLAALGDITWELIWGFTIVVNMGWGLQLVYQFAFFMDCFILVWVFRFGWKETQVQMPALRQVWPYAIVMLIVGMLFFYRTFYTAGYDLPLGSNSAYLDNLMVSSLYLWYGLTRSRRRLTYTSALSKGIGTGMVTVFVFMTYHGERWVHTMAISVAVLDLTYLGLLVARKRFGWDPTPNVINDRTVRSAPVAQT